MTFLVLLVMVALSTQRVIVIAPSNCAFKQASLALAKMQVNMRPANITRGNVKWPFSWQRILILIHLLVIL